MGKEYTRRDFMKKVGQGTLAVGAGTLAPRLLKPAWAAKRDHILIGRPLPFTGPLAGFTEPEKWITERALKEINGQGGVYIKEYGKKVPMKVKFVDTKSDPSMAAELAASLSLRTRSTSYPLLPPH